MKIVGLVEDSWKIDMVLVAVEDSYNFHLME
jgi:hypothetical protein